MPAQIPDLPTNLSVTTRTIGPDPSIGDDLSALALEQMDQGVILVDADLTVKVINGPLYELFGLPRGFMPGADCAQMIQFLARNGEYGPGDPEAIAARHLERALRADPPLYEHRRPDGRVLEVRTRRTSGGGFIRTYTDVTERRRWTVPARWSGW